ncbi:MAG TPA: L-histidine N(alpha)-methyltransferase, partial [Acidimicrobiia bacterium]
STIGNLTPEQRAGFLADIVANLGPGDTFLLGTDLVKDIGRLEAAYDDSAGVTAAFNRNLLHRLNRELDADFAPDAFEHVAVFDKEREWIEMRLRSSVDQVVTIAGLSLTVHFAAGEEMRTEISAKFRPDGLTGELTVAGLRLLDVWTDPDADFAPDRFQHVAVFDTEREWIEMRLRSSVEQTVTVAGLGLTVRFGAGEEMRTEISAKFRPDGLGDELTAAGLQLLELWTDPRGDFALSLSTPK